MLLNLEVNITAGSLTSCPGRCVFYAGCDLFVRPEHGGQRRAVDALDGHRGLIGGGGAIAAHGDARLHCSPLSAAWLPRGRSGSLTVLLGASAGAEAAARSASSVRALA